MMSMEHHVYMEGALRMQEERKRMRELLTEARRLAGFRTGSDGYTAACGRSSYHHRPRRLVDPKDTVPGELLNLLTLLLSDVTRGSFEMAAVRQERIDYLCIRTYRTLMVEPKPRSVGDAAKDALEAIGKLPQFAGGTFANPERPVNLGELKGMRGWLPTPPPDTEGYEYRIRAYPALMVASPEFLAQIQDIDPETGETAKHKYERRSFARLRLRDQVASGGQDSDEALAACERRIEAELAKVAEVDEMLHSIHGYRECDRQGQCLGLGFRVTDSDERGFSPQRATEAKGTWR